LFRLITTFDEVPPCPCAHALPYAANRTRLASCPPRGHITGHRLHETGVDLKRVPPKSRPASWHDSCFARIASNRATIIDMRRARTPPSTFLFLPIHLSNSPGTPRTPLPTTNGEPPKPNPRLQVGDRSPLSVRSFGGAPSRRSGGAPCVEVYRLQLGALSTMSVTVF
jgi:hypothetical protein